MRASTWFYQIWFCQIWLRHISVIALGAVAWFAAPSPADAQRAQPPMDMQEVASSLGVECGYCHAGRRGAPPDPAANLGTPKIQIAKAMMEMTQQLNATIQAATGKDATLATKVTCATCHRGVPIPKPMDQILWDTAMTQGGDAAVDRYHELKERFYGHGVYDFSEQMLDRVVNKMANVNAEPALLLAALNIEQYPDSSNAFTTLAYVFTRLYDDASAIASLRRALELDPNNAAARGRLEQLKGYYPELRKSGQAAEQAGSGEDGPQQAAPQEQTSPGDNPQ